MAASAHEAILARVAALLAGAGTAAGARITRGRVDAFAPEEVPAINVRRAPSQNNPFAQGQDQCVMEFELDHFTSGDDWETTTDALHMQAHAAMAADTVLLTLGRGLRCTRTEPRAEAAEQTAGRLTATYQMQALVATNDLTRKLR